MFRRIFSLFLALLMTVGCLACLETTAAAKEIEPQEALDDQQNDTTAPIVLYQDNFENETTWEKDWIKPDDAGDNATLELAEDTTETGETGNHFLRINKVAKTNSSFLAKHPFDAPLTQGILEVSYKMRVSKNDSKVVAYVIVSGPVEDGFDGNASISQVGMYGATPYGENAGSIGYMANNVKTAIHELKAGEWYEFRLVYDTETRTFNIFVDGEQCASELSYDADVDIANLWVGVYKNSTDLLIDYDDFLVTHHVKPERTYTAQEVCVDTIPNKAPSLPTQVSATDQWGFSKTVSVSWDPIDPDKYATAGNTFTVNGTLDGGGTVTAKVSVLGLLEVLYNENFTAIPEGLPEGWTVEEIDGNSVLKIPQGSDVSNASIMLPEDKIPAITSEYIVIEGKMRLDDVAAGATLAVLNENGKRIAQVAMNKDKGTLCIGSYDGAGDMGYYGFDSYAANEWVTFRFVLDPLLQRYHVYLGDNAVMKHMGFQAKGTIGGIELGAMDTAGGNVYFDDIKISIDRTPRKAEVVGLDISVESGDSVSLPTLVSVSYGDGNDTDAYDDSFVDVWNITWDDPPATAENDATVTGTASSFWAEHYGNARTETVTANIHVRGKSNVAFYVDPVNGNDSNAGTSAEAAFKTLEKARAAVRDVNDNMTGDIYVYLMDGTFELTDTFVLSSEDSGSNGYHVHWAAAPDATPVISGGKQITGWEKVAGKDYYVASVSPENGYSGYFRQLYVNDERATRASSGWFQGQNFVSDADGHITGWKVETANLEEYQNLTDVRLFKAKGFKMEEYHIYNMIDNGDGTTTLTLVNDEDKLFTYRDGGAHLSGKNPIMIIGALEELDAPGEWCFDSTSNKVYYYPYDDQNMETANVIATVMEVDQLLRLEGTTGNEVKNITIEGISFMYSNWMYPSKYGIGGSQAEILYPISGTSDLTYGYEIPGAVRLNHTRNIDFLNNVIAHTGGCGIHVYNDAQFTRIEGNVTYDTTGAGIQVGRYGGVYLNDDSPSRDETEKFTEENLEGRVSDTIINNNFVTDTGRDFLQATGINTLATLRTTITHNYVVNTAYMGIHNRTAVTGHYLSKNGTGYMDNPADTTQDVGQNIIAFNHLGQTAWDFAYSMEDNGSIYSFGPVPGTLVYQNYAEKTSATYTFYTDNSSLNIMWKDNRGTKPGNTIGKRRAVIDKHSIVDSGNSQSGMDDVIANAGLEAAYQDIVNRAILPTVHESYATYQHLKTEFVTPQKASTPAAEVDYVAEKLTGLALNGRYMINGTEFTSDSNGTLAINEAWFGTTISIVRKGATEALNSDAQTIELAARPAAPTAAAGSEDGTIIDVTDALEYSVDGGMTWTRVSGTLITGLPAGEVQIRVAATETAPHGQVQIVTVTGSVDKEALEDAIEAGEKIVNDNYTDASWKALQDALERGRAVLNDSDATQEEVDAATNAIDSAIENLEQESDKPIVIVPPVSDLPVIDIDEDKLPFTDVKAGDWYYDAVKYAYSENLMNGTGSNRFSPNGYTTRGMIVTILYRMSGSPAVASDNASWWSDARVWAMKEGISDGTNMDGEVTREQLAAMLYRYAKYSGMDVSSRSSLTGFADVEQVSDWAEEAMEWAVATGILTGKPGARLDPQGLATRAEVATMLMRLNQRIG